MANSNRQYKDTTLGYIFVITYYVVLTMVFSSCYGTYYLTDSEYSDAREEHASITYYNNQIYWGWNSGYYYYYGKPHYYPWYYYYNACPPSHYHTTTHIVINKPVNNPRPNWNKSNRNTTSKSSKVIIKNGSKRTNKATIRRKTKK